MTRRPSRSIDPGVELGDALEVDDDLRPDRAVAQADDQVGAAGQARGGRTVRGQEADRLGEAAGRS